MCSCISSLSFTNRFAFVAAEEEMESEVKLDAETLKDKLFAGLRKEIEALKKIIELQKRKIEKLEDIDTRRLNIKMRPCDELDQEEEL